MVPGFRSHELQGVAAIGGNRERGGFQCERRVAAQGPGANHVAIDQRHNGLIAVKGSVCVPRAKIETKSVTTGGKASNRLPNKRADALQEDCLIEGQSIKRWRIECSVGAGEAGANIQVGSSHDRSQDPSEVRARVEVLRRDGVVRAREPRPLVGVAGPTRDGYGPEVEIDEGWLRKCSRGKHHDYRKGKELERGRHGSPPR